MGRLTRGIRYTVKAFAAAYLLLNLCVATIPRCDAILNVLQHTLKNQNWATLAHHGDAEHCRDIATDSARIHTDKICECSLVKFVFITLPHFDPQRFIGFQVQTTRLLSFAISLWNPAAQSGPEPPYPRIFPV